MTIRLTCDYPGCTASVTVGLSEDTRLNLRGTIGWWVVSGATTRCACSTPHLNVAVAAGLRAAE
jgi:hypothetical protein